MNALDIWDDACFLRLAALLQDSPSLEFDEVDDCAADAVQVLWDSADLVEQHDKLEHLRNGCLPGGSRRVEYLGSSVQ